MFIHLRSTLLSVTGLVCLAVFATGAEPVAPTPPPRERLVMDANWKFSLGHASDPKADFNFGVFWSYLAKQNHSSDSKVHGASFDDTPWRTVSLPHDWGMELPFVETATPEWGSRPLGRLYPATSIGWYRRYFTLPATDQGRRISLEFDGVSHDCQVFVNGVYLGSHFSSFTSFSFDITDLVHCGGENLVVVRVDAQNNECWWYQGAGIYRHVWLTKTAPVHIPQWGTQVLTTVANQAATVTSRIDVVNDSAQPATVVAQATVLDDAGNAVGTASAPAITLAPWEHGLASAVVSVAKPKLWSLESPTLYRVVARLKIGDNDVDRTETPFGIRTIHFDPDRGFLLNGQHVLIKGLCDHEQHAVVGTAVPDALWPLHIKQLQELGGNANRMSHNPPTPEFLDACDRLGMLVMDEQRLFSSSEEGLKQLDSLVRRDRNHPSIIIWSAGNEEWALQSHPDGAPIMRRLQEEFHRLDPSRPVTFAASNGNDVTGVNEVAEVRGINYLHLFDKLPPSEWHTKHPAQPVIGTEDDGGNPRMDFMKDNPWYSGVFLWTGFSYYGESKWPEIVAPFGALDLCGFPRQPSYNRLRAAWAGKPAETDAQGKNPARVTLEPDRTTLSADGADVVVINLAVVDNQGQRVGNADTKVTITITGPGVLLGIGNGDTKDRSPAQLPSHALFMGRGQALVRTTNEAGTITVQATADGLTSAPLALTTTKSGSRNASVR
jgi:beta-galactosidase